MPNRFTVAVAGGQRAGTNLELGMAVTKAYHLARRGYVVWIRQTDRASWAAIVLTIRPGDPPTVWSDDPQQRFVQQATEMIGEIHARAS